MIKLRFRSKRSALLFVVALLAGMVGYIVYDHMGHHAYERAWDRPNGEWAARKRQCLDTVEAAAKEAFPAGVLSREAAPPADAKALRDAPFANRDSRGVVYPSPRPGQPGVPGKLCDPAPDGTATLPPVVAFEEVTCSPTCVAVSAWLDVPARRLLGVVRVTGAADTVTLEHKLADAIAHF
jgi:hypothetical protein